MPNRRTHGVVGALTGGTVAAVRVSNAATPDFAAEMIGGIIGGWIGGVLPDVIEPATSPNHRQLAHSVLAGGVLSLARVAEWQAGCRRSASAVAQRALLLPVGSPERGDAELAAAAWRLAAGILIGLVVGYASHLALDACTPRGLPLIGPASDDRT